MAFDCPGPDTPLANAISTFFSRISGAGVARVPVFETHPPMASTARTFSA
jgi:hypothetical protein